MAEEYQGKSAKTGEYNRLGRVFETSTANVSVSPKVESITIPRCWLPCISKIEIYLRMDHVRIHFLLNSYKWRRGKAVGCFTHFAYIVLSTGSIYYDTNTDIQTYLQDDDGTGRRRKNTWHCCEGVDVDAFNVGCSVRTNDQSFSDVICGQMLGGHDMRTERPTFKLRRNFSMQPTYWHAFITFNVPSSPLVNLWTYYLSQRVWICTMVLDVIFVIFSLQPIPPEFFGISLYCN